MLRFPFKESQGEPWAVGAADWSQRELCNRAASSIGQAAPPVPLWNSSVGPFPFFPSSSLKI
eukprot:1265904-Pyramimonas_sp.AAC.1